jgi:mono/diheme cytochrome c family protein
MERTRVCAAVGITALVTMASVAPGAWGQGLKSQWDGIYTSAQATRGASLYEANCAPCHRWDLKGTEIAPALTGPAFTGRWNGRPIGDLLDYTWALMPQFRPGGLSRQQNADLLAFIFQVGGAAAGRVELAADAESLKVLTFVAK